MFKAYFDDSEIRGGPVFTLAGFAATTEQWAAFDEQWQLILDMSPRVSHFKFIEAMNLNGEFQGMSPNARDEKMALLIGLIEELGLVSISVGMPEYIYKFYFMNDSDRRLHNPYFMLFYSAISRLCRYCKKYEINEKIELVFDDQPGQVERVLNAWSDYASKAPEEYKDLIGNPPAFRNDRTTLALQAADFAAGLARSSFTTALAGGAPPQWPWHNIRKNKDEMIPHMMTIVRWEDAEAAFREVHGYSRWSYSFTLSNAKK